MRALGWVVMAAAMGLAACGDDLPDDPQQVACQPGDRIPCTCADGSEGTLECPAGSGPSMAMCSCTDGTGGTGGQVGGGSGGAGGEPIGGGGAGGVGGSGGAPVEPVEPVEPVCTQVPSGDLPHCEPDLDGKISAICLLDGCADAGPRDPETDEIRRGDIKVYGTVQDPLAPIGTVRSFGVDVFDRRTHVGGLLTCDAILAAEGTIDPAWNLVRRRNGMVSQTGQTIPSLIQSVPLNDESSPYLAVMRLYNGPISNEDHNPTGGLVLVGCTDDVVVLEGPWVQDPARDFIAELYVPENAGD